MATVLREVGGEGAPIGEGWMACDVVGSWARYAAGLGVSEPVDSELLDALVDFYRSRECCPRIQVTPYQHPSLLEGLAARYFTPSELETVLVHSLQQLPDPVLVPSLVFRLIEPWNSDDVEAFIQSQMHGFHGSAEPPLGIIPITKRVAQHARCRLWLLEVDGELAGSGGLEFFEDTAVMIAGCVYPEFRRRGIHSAFMNFRLAEAQSADVKIVLVASPAGGPTERNALRVGFSVAYHLMELSQRIPPR
jgi:GNAT superfamily N-acetyltransferase